MQHGDAENTKPTQTQADRPGGQRAVCGGHCCRRRRTPAEGDVRRKGARPADGASTCGLCASDAPDGTQHRGTPDPLLAWRPRGGRSAHGRKLRTPGALRPRYKSHLSSGGREMSTCSLYGRLMQSEGQGKPLSYLTAILCVCVRVCVWVCACARARVHVFVCVHALGGNTHIA